MNGILHDWDVSTFQATLFFSFSDGPWDGKTVEIRGFTDRIEKYMLQLIFEDKDLSGIYLLKTITTITYRYSYEVLAMKSNALHVL